MWRVKIHNHWDNIFLSYLKPKGENVHFLDEAGLVCGDKLEQGNQWCPKLFPRVTNANSGSFLVGQESVDHCQSMHVKLVGKSFHHMRPNKLNLQKHHWLNQLKNLKISTHHEVHHCTSQRFGLWLRFPLRIVGLSMSHRSSMKFNSVMKTVMRFRFLDN